ncbi:MAG: efflux RND transporter permease subunit, partial [Gammaproteobacteria bacterium]|nr:efflux RND transporter permease subunit [Gammaproteobacteria bacterium]
NLVMGFSVFAGLAALDRIPVKLYPDVDPPLIIVTVPYLGAAPEEVESGVCTRVEESLEGITGIREIRSASIEDLCTVQVEMFFDTDRMRTLG